MQDAHIGKCSVLHSQRYKKKKDDKRLPAILGHVNSKVVHHKVNALGHY